MSENNKDSEKLSVKKLLEISEKLPKDVFAAVPDDDTVSIKISGSFNRAMHKTLEYIINSVSPEEATRALQFIKRDYKDCDTTLVKDHDVALWTMMNMMSEFNAQAGVQKKTKIYDRDQFMAALIEKRDPVMPLTDDEISSRIIKEEEKTNKSKEDDSELKKLIERGLKDAN